MFFKVTFWDPDWHQKIKELAGPWKKCRFLSGLTPINCFLGHNISLGLRAEAEDLGLSANPRSLLAPSKWGPAVISISCSLEDIDRLWNFQKTRQAARQGARHALPSLVSPIRCFCFLVFRFHEVTSRQFGNMSSENWKYKRQGPTLRKTYLMLFRKISA